MLFLLRQLRRLELHKRSGRYFLYAFGEVVLIVVGIMIALQINNWNEGRKNRIVENEVLQNLAKNLETNAQRLENQINGIDRQNESNDFIISAFDSKLPYDSSFDGHFAWGLNPLGSHAPLSGVGYETLRNVGFGIIQNGELKNEIVNLFEETYLDMKRKLDRIGEHYMEIVKLRQKHFLRLPGSGYLITPFDYNGLIEDQNFYSWMIAIKEDRNWVKESIEKSLAETKRVLGLIQLEVGETK